ncbi:DNA replication/repair protein RecF [Salisediminibacterium halotolerans]|uniref:DNA replication and repair protein RecF n=1 Tax=Salisediminibacterium halotolerans TaxID=517425 RepID=A0A1H9WN12_9BACI|nr:DNA replication/repair protein RecF [Salisediminibacterium haloalkalitolerans]SES35290.1 DNA replication and repair protein RecF [Salisediminibacterium haloalkalitolerans]
MHINELHLKDYRNYEDLHLFFENRINVIIGENAQGKTNMMEAIYVLGMARSHRTPRDKELIRWEQPFSRVEGQLTNRHGPAKMEVIFSKQGKKVKLNGLEKKRLTDYIGACTIVMFAPEDLALVKGSPQIRRRFLDMEMGQIYTVYLYYLSQYHKILKQRNQWLKDVAQNKTAKNEAFFEVMTDQLVEAGAEVIQKRFTFLKKLENWAQPIHENITQGTETLAIDYVPSAPVDASMSTDEIKTALKAEYVRLFEQEIRRATTVLGPHRDDLKFLVNGHDIQVYGSQGQQRTTALSVKLAEIELIYEKTGEYPILLLDDVLSELDDSRQTHLLDTIQGKVQTFVTTTNVGGIHHEMLEKATMFHVTGGSIDQTD